jgi:glycosyltransferase involved in cell wall biosynthesis
MACGCVPIVYRNGGPYIDIINYNKYGLSFEKVDELANKINLILDDNETFKISSKKAIERSKVFSEDAFKSKLMEIVES